tara:strand:- start:98 stop:1057 length:960 start_codon:yes stop_codon:yes gene_type:complete
MFRIFILNIIFSLLFLNFVHSDDLFINWLKDFKTEALLKGISEETLLHLDGLNPIEKNIKLDRNQPEFKISLDKYINNLISIDRISKGKKELKKNKDLLDKISQKYNVQSRFIIALWAIESDFGRNMGNHNILQSLITLAYDGRRSKYFRKELLSALNIIELNMVKNPEIIGSWAGAMGQCQFMPSAYLLYSQDWDGDGFSDIWGNQGDVFASIANYLKNEGWNNNYTWGRKVNIENIVYEKKYSNTNKLISYWSSLGVKSINNSSLPNVRINARLINPNKNNSTAYLVYKNFDTILRWNRSNHFGITVGLLSDSLMVK